MKGSQLFCVIFCLFSWLVGLGFLDISGLSYIKGADTFCWSEKWRSQCFIIFLWGHLFLLGCDSFDCCCTHWSLLSKHRYLASLYRVTETQNDWGWKGSLESSEPAQAGLPKVGYPYMRREYVYLLNQKIKNELKKNTTGKFK